MNTKNESDQANREAWATRLGALTQEARVGVTAPNTPFANRNVAPLPKRINLGSGKNWHPDFLNIDINDAWNPDVVADFNHIFPGERAVLRTERFGEVVIGPGQFEVIVAHDVLEHVRELTTCVTNCLNLLVNGGLFEIVVPYDLSYGAWQDPTHVRAFNERSWLYYTDWFWYLGWSESRFETIKLDFHLSEIGKALAAKGMQQEQITSTPRAVDSMRVVLRKIPLSDDDRRVLAQQQRGPQR